MPWKECHVVDERLRFIARLLDGEKMWPPGERVEQLSDPATYAENGRGRTARRPGGSKRDLQPSAASALSSSGATVVVSVFSKSLASANRRSGSFSRQRRIASSSPAGIAGLIADRRGGGSCTWFTIVASGVSPVN